MVSSSFPQENGKLSALPLLPIEIHVKMHNSTPTAIKRLIFITWEILGSVELHLKKLLKVKATTEGPQPTKQVTQVALTALRLTVLI